MSNLPENKFSIFKEFTLFQYTDSLFREKPEGTKVTFTRKLHDLGTTTIQWGVYRMGDDRQWEHVDGLNVLAILTGDGDDCELWYADEVLAALSEDETVTIKFGFIESARNKVNGAPF